MEKEFVVELSHLEDIKDEQSSEIRKIKDKLRELQVEREKYEDIVTKDNSNIPALQRLNQIDTEIEENKKIFYTVTKESHQVDQNIRKIKLNYETNVIDNLKDDLRKLKVEKDRIRTDLIPAAKKALEELEENENQLSTHIIILSNKISELETNFDA